MKEFLKIALLGHTLVWGLALLVYLLACFTSWTIQPVEWAFIRFTEGMIILFSLAIGLLE